MPSAQPEPHVGHLRLVFEYKDSEFNLVRKVPVSVAGAPLPTEALPGLYVETRNSRDVTLSRVLAPSAYISSAEVFPENSGEPFLRMNVRPQNGAFTVIVPITKTATRIALVEAATRPNSFSVNAVTIFEVAGREPLEYREIASFPLSADSEESAQ